MYSAWLLAALARAFHPLAGGDSCVYHRTDFHCLLRCDADASEEEVQLCQERTAELSALVNEFILRKNALGSTVSLLCLCLPARFTPAGSTFVSCGAVIYCWPC